MFCPHCGKEVAEGQIFCQHCGARIAEEHTSETAIEPAQGGGGRAKTPWEDREIRGFFSGLFKTLNESLFHPSDFFKKMSVTGGLTDPLLYALIVGMVGMMSSYFWQIALKSTMQDLLPGMPASAEQHMIQSIGMAVLAFLSPFLIIIGLFISAGILHLCLMLVKGARNGFEATFRVVAYGYSANVFLLIPFCGGLLYGVWAIILYIIGLKEAHETTGGKAAVAVFLPALVCCGLIMIAMALFMGAIAASFSALSQMQK